MKPTNPAHTPSSSLLRSPARRRLLVAIAALTPCLSPAASSLYLAFGTDTRPGPLQHLINVSDLHGDHYHVFTINNGTHPSSHTPMPLEVEPGSGSMPTIELGSANISPFTDPVTHFPDSPAGLFRLQLENLSPGLLVHFVHGNHTHSMFAGSAETLSLTAVEEVRFSVADGSPLGLYQADFKIVDANGHYLESASIGASTFTSQFSILVNAVPEPSSALLTGAAFAIGLVRRRR